jgi:hypothetical protein
MKPLNTYPIENYIEKAKIASKSGQKQVILDIKDAVALSESLAVVMTRLSGELDKILSSAGPASDVIEVKMDGGGFK